MRVPEERRPEIESFAEVNAANRKRA